MQLITFTGKIRLLQIKFSHIFLLEPPVHPSSHHWQRVVVVVQVRKKQRTFGHYSDRSAHPTTILSLAAHLRTLSTLDCIDSTPSQFCLRHPKGKPSSHFIHTWALSTQVQRCLLPSPFSSLPSRAPLRPPSVRTALGRG